MTQTKANTTVGFTSQLDLLVKTVPISCLFLIGRVITHHVLDLKRKLTKFLNGRRSNYSPLFRANEKT